jgi:hypothetical protein
MKRTKLSWVTAFGFAVLTLSAFMPSASAQTRTLELADLLPQDVDQLVELNTQVEHPFGAMLEEMASAFNFDNGSMTEDQSARLNTLLENNTLSFASKNVWTEEDGYTYADPDMYAALHGTREDLVAIAALPDEPDEVVNGIRVDIPEGEDGDVFIGYFGDLIVVTNNRQNLNALVNNYNTSPATTLAKNADYMQIKAKALSGSFFNMYVNPAGYQNMYEGSVGAVAPVGLEAMMSMQTELMAAIKGEGISVAQTSSGFNFSVFVKGDGSKLSELDLSFDRYNFVPELYRYVNGNNLMLYGEENNIEGKMNDLMRFFLSDAEMSQAFTDWKNDLNAQGNVNFDTEILPLLAGKYAMTVHKSNQLWPAVTMIIDVRNHRNEAGSVLSRLVDYADKSFTGMEEDEGVDFYSRGVSSFNGTAYYDLTFDPSKLPDSDMDGLTREQALVTIHAAITSEGFLVITNAPNVGDVYTLDGKGLMNISSFNQSVTQNETLAGLGYLNMDTVEDYVFMLMDMFGAPVEAEDFAKGLLDPWHEIFTKSYATADTAWATGFVNVDLAGLTEYRTLFENYFNMGYTGEEYSYPLMPGTTPLYAPAQFCDVHDSDWFAPYVEELAQNDIVRGYSDGCFKPGNEITRAEFLKMAIEATDSAGMMTYESMNYDLPSAGFNDVESDDWYAHYIDQGVHLEWIEGYGDDTFRPNAHITRAEAVTILYRILHNQNLLDAGMETDLANNPSNYSRFTDVRTEDWFFSQIAVAFNEGLVSGVTTTSFEPGRNLNRAEAAKIIKLFRDLELAGKIQ